MFKKIILAHCFIFFLFAGCSIKSGEPGAYGDTINNKNISDEIKKDLSELEEPMITLDYSPVMRQYSKMLLPDISVTRYKYFIVFSELKPEITYRLISNDIKNTIDGMLNSYITVKPDRVIPIVLFEDYDSYRDFSMNNFQMEENDLSPYGFYKISRNAIVIRYVSWKGSLSHEMTHALIQPDFPDIPSWLNEGMASLNEKSSFKNGELIGDFSWRIIPVRNAISENTYTGIETLMKTNDEELYGKRTVFYYGQSRYLLMMLQEKNLLKSFYKDFKNTYETDHTGITQLEKITGKTTEQLDKELLDYLDSFKQ